ncbi:hypothetical protein AB4Z48_04240 [Cupriavidus sp. 2TAF22]|uniref:hypothetical protein n=1 Tax=unclassified Cupriavidus TaxID=2640874 RepID=UPI003F901AF4
MKRVLIQGAIVLSAAAFGLPAMAQQAPINQPNPSAPPTEGQNQSDRNMAGAQMDNSSGMSKSDAKSKGKSTHRADKPRQQDANRAPSADAPSGPKGDSPSPAPKQ